MSIPKLPPIPGAGTYQPARESFHKKSSLKFANGVNVVAGDEDSPKKKAPSAAALLGETTPPWLAFDRQSLAFDCYFQEPVFENPNEHYRIRRCKLNFFPEDDTLQVSEHKTDNSGLQQGTLVRRSKVPKGDLHASEHITVNDLNVGAEVTIYGRTYMLTNCDKFTRDFLTKLGVAVPDPVGVPEDPYTTLRATQKAAEMPLRPYAKTDKLKQFLDHDGQVLRFYCVWDERDVVAGGEKRFMVLLYFLADNTIEVKEVRGPNSGRDGPATFLKRCVLPKTVPPVVQPGTMTNRTLLNVFPGKNMTGRHIDDNLYAGHKKDDNYTDKDLEVGAEVNVFGRNILLCDCDDFTRQYYREKFGLEQAAAIDVSEPEPPKPTRTLPPHNGIGTDEDSLVSVNKLVLQPPKKDFEKWFKEGPKVLQFKAKMETEDRINQERRFAISFFLADDTLVINEEKIKNSGIDGGKFLERKKLRIPSGERYYRPDDFALGRVMEINRHRFLLTDTTEFTLAYMEEKKFPESDWDVVGAKMRDVLSSRKDEVAAALQGPVAFETFRAILLENDGGNLTEQEIRTAGRHFGIVENGELTVQGADFAAEVL